MSRDMKDYEHLPNIVLRMFGINHCFWGFAIMVLGFVELGITADDADDYWNPTTDRWQSYLYYAPAAIIFCAALVSYWNLTTDCFCAALVNTII